MPGRVAARALSALPLLAVLVVLAPYVWPLDHAPDAEFSDVHHLHLPYVRLLADGLEDGALPRWNPQDFAGVPVVGDPQAGLANPLYWLLALRPTGHSFGLLILAYALAGALCFQVYARAGGVSAAAAAAGAVVFVLGGCLLLRLVLPGHVVFGPVLLLPGLVWLLDRATERPTPGRIAAGALLVGFLIVSLHPQALLYGGMLTGILIVPALVRCTDRLRAVGVLASVALLGLCLAAVHVLPVLALASEFSRGQAAFADTVSRAEFVPDAAWLAGLVNRVPGGSIEWEWHLYVGGPALFLIGVGLLAWPGAHPHRRLAAIHGALALAVLAFAIGGIALGPFRLPTRALILVGLPLGMLTALGVDALSATPERRRAIVTGSAWLVALLAVLTGADELPLFMLLGSGGGALLLGATAASGARAGDDTVPFARLAGAVTLIALLAWDAGRIVAPWVQTTPEETLGTLAPGVVLPPDIADAGRIVELERGAVAPGIPEMAVRAGGLETLAGYNPLIPWRFVLFASHATGLDPFAYHFDIAVPLIDEAAPHLFDLLGVTHVLRPLSEDPPPWEWRVRPNALPRAYLVPSARVVAAGPDTIAADRAALGTLATIDPRRTVLVHGEDGAAALARHGIDETTALAPFRAVPLQQRRVHELRLDVTLERPGVLVVNAPFVRGWRAWDDGREIPVVRTNVLFRGLVLGPGAHRIRLEFAPSAWRWGRRVSALALLVVLGLLVAGRAAGRASPE